MCADIIIIIMLHHNLFILMVNRPAGEAAPPRVLRHPSSAEQPLYNYLPYMLVV